MRHRRFLGMFLATLPLVATASECYLYGTPDMSVTGSLSRDRSEGLTIGKRPAKVIQVRWVLYSSVPFCVNGDEKSGNIHMEGASMIELVPPNDKALAPFIGKKVTVVGEFLPTYIPHYHAYLIMNVKTIREASK